MEKKYELTEETKEVNGHILHRIKALRDFRNVKKGDLGGWIESEYNLRHSGNCWVGDEALAYGNARIFGDAQIYGNARIFGDAQVYGNAWIFGDARVFGNARVYENVCVFGRALIYKNAIVKYFNIIC